MALKALLVPLRHEVAGLDFIVPTAGRTSKGTAVSLFVQRGRDPLHSAELVITAPADRAAVAAQLATNGQAAAIEQGLVRLSFMVENALRERDQEEAAARRGAKEARADTTQGRPVEFNDPDPWPDPVNGVALLAELRTVLDRYLVLPAVASALLALWILHTWLVQCFEHTPYLAITSPVKRSGKTTTLRVVQAHVRRPLPTDNVSPSVLFRVFGKGPTVLIDELDRVPKESEIWQIINSGHRRGGAVLRSVPVGDDFEPRAFETFGAKILAYIRGARSSVPDTVEDRSIRITLQRRGRGERREKLRTPTLEAGAKPLCQQLARWAQDHEGALLRATPAIPDELDDRAADGWTSLLAIADEVGGEWPRLARELAVRFSAERDEDEGDGVGVLLLRDLGSLIEAGDLRPDPGAGGFEGELMVRLLHAIDDRPWRSWGRLGKPIAQTGLARLLRPFDVRPLPAGPKHARVRRYPEDKLKEAVARFPVCGLEPSSPTCTPAHGPGEHDVSDSLLTGVRVCTSDPHTEGQANLFAAHPDTTVVDETDCRRCGRDTCPGDC